MFDLIKVNTYNHADKDRIAKKHIDYLIVDQNNHCNMTLAIELNGPSHETEKSIERDEFVSGIYASIGLNFITFQNEDLENKEGILNVLR
jgi:very-short-patch-repair endonuclease